MEKENEKWFNKASILKNQKYLYLIIGLGLLIQLIIQILYVIGLYWGIIPTTIQAGDLLTFWGSEYFLHYTYLSIEM